MKRAYKSTVVLLCLGLFFATLPAQAQLAPTPRKSPRTPVRQEKLVTPEKPSLPASRVLQGTALVVDSERVKINGIEVRLFGVVPPLLSASYGPQARAALDALARAGTATCRVRDRTRDGHLLASCKNAENQDFGAELLRRGLAVTARGTLHGTELATPYIAAEEAAKAQKLGLWSVVPIAASDSSILKAAQKEKEKAQAEQAAKEQAAKETTTKKEEQQPPSPAPQTESEAVPSSPPALTAEERANALGAETETPTPEETALENSSPMPAEKDFVETYQLLITGLVLLLAAFIFAGSFVFVREREKKDSLRATAAALRGELMAARAICLARLSRFAKENDEKTVSWPRLRHTVFQAYVGQLGRLGADLSRQIASIYGQSTDYSSYYVGADDKPEAASKKQSLQMLVQHIEEVVPRLADIEQRGAIAGPKRNARVLSSLLSRAAQPLSLSGTAKTSETTKRIESLPAPDNLGEGESTEETEGDARATNESFREETANAAPAASAADTTEHEIAEKKTEAPKETETQTKAPSGKKKQTAKPVLPLPPKPRLPRGAAKKRRPPTTAEVAKTTPVIGPTQTAIAAAKEALLAVMHELDFREPLAESFAMAKNFASDKWKKINPPLSASIEDIIPDYANLTEEELEALAYADEYLFSDEDIDGDRKVG